MFFEFCCFWVNINTSVFLFQLILSRSILRWYRLLIFNSFTAVVCYSIVATDKFVLELIWICFNKHKSKIQINFINYDQKLVVHQRETYSLCWSSISISLCGLFKVEIIFSYYSNYVGLQISSIVLWRTLASGLFIGFVSSILERRTIIFGLRSFLLYDKIFNFYDLFSSSALTYAISTKSSMWRRTNPRLNTSLLK